MTGVVIIGALLRGYAPLTARVPAKWIAVGEMPGDAPMQALLIRSISLIDRHSLRRGALVHSTERVAVTIRAETYRDQVELVRLVRTACGGFTGDLAEAEAERIAVHTDGLGPDLRGASGSFEKTQDFRTSYDAPA